MTHFSVKTKVYSGVGSLSYLNKFSGKKIWIVCDGFLASSPLFARLENQLKEKNEVYLFSDISPDPDIETVVKGIEQLHKIKPQVIIGFGGGSAIDAAKAMNFIASQHQDLGLEYCIAIPTTSGTGSEVSSATVISDKQQGKKHPIFHPDIFPDVAILDPELTVTLPDNITANTGMDVLTHAIEAYVSTGADDFTDALAEKATYIVFKYLPIAFRNGKCVSTREKMHNASAMAGMAFTQSGLGINHALAHQLGAQYHMPHGLANALLLPHTIKLNAKDIRARKRYARLAKFCQLCPKGVNDNVAVNQLVYQIRQLLKEINIKGTMRANGVDHRQLREKLPEMVKATQADKTFETNPYRASENEIRKLFEAVV
ncbi:iron-containing alcohol dehydrogenase [Vibrio hannami]|uniref:1-propanol dehydrogenase PduQ n=1 Tax=Vibrio hannami TaxID=2717094 RepID=UPI002410AB7C|nr:1-propanol dehydrogenase PduQ [Vibrio hannami]MDG3085135.1 iron-containing alcohol dehydrogenase [Vibrio hannami]